MLAAKPTLSAGAGLALTGNRLAAPSMLSVKQAPAGAAGGVVLSLDAKRTVATRAAVAGRADSSDDDPKPKAEMIMRMAEATSALLVSLCVPRQSTNTEQLFFSKEVEALKKSSDAMAEFAAVDVDGAITVLVGIHGRIRMLLTSGGNQTPDLLVSSMGQTKKSVEEYLSVQAKAKPTVAGLKRATWLEIIDKISLEFRPEPTVCSPEEVMMVLKKTVELIEAFNPLYSSRVKASVFRKVRSDCRALLEQIEKNGVEEKTKLSIVLLHIMLIGTLGQHKKIFDYEDVADDPLMSSLRRLEVALRNYKMEGPSAEDSDE